MLGFSVMARGTRRGRPPNARGWHGERVTAPAALVVRNVTAKATRYGRGFDGTATVPPAVPLLGVVCPGGVIFTSALYVVDRCIGPAKMNHAITPSRMITATAQPAAPLPPLVVPGV